MITLEELKLKLASQFEECMLIELLNLSSYDIVEAFSENIEENFEELLKEILDEIEQDYD